MTRQAALPGLPELRCYIKSRARLRRAPDLRAAPLCEHNIENYWNICRKGSENGRYSVLPAPLVKDHHLGFTIDRSRYFLNPIWRCFMMECERSVIQLSADLNSRWSVNGRVVLELHMKLV